MPGEDNNEAVSRTFAGMAGELEELADRLTKRHSDLAKELAAVEDELRRVESVRAAMFGKTPKRPPLAARQPSMSGVKTMKGKERVQRILHWARDHGEFTAAEAATTLDVPTQGIGPVLAGMVRRGEVTVRDDAESGTRHYALAGERG